MYSGFVLAHLALFLTGASAFYLPGVAPKEYAKGDEIPILVNSLSSEPLEGARNSVFNFDYYNEGFGFCKPEGGPKAVGGSLGSILFGDRIYTSPMSVKVLEDVSCRFVCSSEYDENKIGFLIRRIRQDFVNHWSLDSLPVAGAYFNQSDIGEPLDDTTEEFSEGIVFADEIQLGWWYLEEDEQSHVAELLNHVDFTVEYHEMKSGKYEIVGVIARPFSRDNRVPSNPSDFKCDSKTPLKLKSDAESATISYSYSVSWVASERPWASRWDPYLHVYGSMVNWFALINSSILIVVLVSLCSMALVRMLRKDIAQYNEVDLSENVQEDIGWKLVHGDVYRPPKFLMLFSIMAGSGAQILASLATTVFLAVLGLLSPASRGAFPTALVLMMCIYGGLAGFVSSAFYKAWGGESWKVNVLLTPVVVPGIAFAMFLLVNFLLIFSDSSGAVPFGSIAALTVVWVLIALPISFFFGFLGRKRDYFKAPVRVNQIARQIPSQPWYLQTVPMILLSGLLPFLSISLQLYYIVSAIWFNRLYYMFGFAFASVLAMTVISAAVSALFLYAMLNAEDYRWQWRSFLLGGSPAIYIFAYSVYYMYRHMKLATMAGTLLYLAYCILVALLSYLALGFAGALTAHFFVRKIYTSIKVD